MPRKISLSDLNALDVDCSFDRMKQEAVEAAEGDESKALYFLTESVLKGFFKKLEAGYDHGLPPELRNHIENIKGTNILHVMEKKITASDLNRNQNRLLFSENSVKNQFLYSQEEINKVNQPSGLQVKVIQPCLETIEEVELKKRTKNHGTYSEFVLTRNWFKMAENKMNHLHTNDTVRLWSFRKGSELCFALVKT
ncbi:hypothetical protein Ddye_007425 [Dipteronia dyeriana]|uniref:B3 domain-containing protein n=1 Tax=Dipteronia dyeriana TaxID=168575 RepID=A0AAD9XK76_9ROSI|nr:hypothetical protein Ddye_007425 [Dipteronia dyeriana]